MEKGLHGKEVYYLLDIVERHISAGQRCNPDYRDDGIYVWDSWNDEPFKLNPEDEGTVWEFRYFEGRANWLDTEYKPREISKYRLDRKREYAKAEPNGRTAELVGYIDWLLCRMEKMYDVLDDMPTSIESLVDFSDCGDDQQETD